MNFDLIFGGVGGQGILSIAFVLDNAALKQGLHLKQSEVHGMAQRGGAVSSHLRLSDRPIFSDMVPVNSAHLLLGVEPMEALRYLDFLAPDGRIVSSTTPEINIPNYPETERILDVLLRQSGTVLLNGNKVAREAGSHRAQNMVVLGAASPYVPIAQELLEELIRALFGRKGDKVVQANINAFRYGRLNGQLFLRCTEQGADPQRVLRLMDHLESATLEPAAARRWCDVIASPMAAELDRLWQDEPKRTIAGTGEMAGRLIGSGVATLTTTG